MFFAFFGLFNTMLILASVLGVVVIIFGFTGLLRYGHLFEYEHFRDERNLRITFSGRKNMSKMQDMGASPRTFPHMRSLAPSKRRL